MQTVRVVHVDKLSDDAVVLHLEKPEGFTYKAGQFIVVQGEVNGKPQRRSYSLASAPHEDVLLVAVRAQPYGVFSPYLCSLTTKDTVDILGPFGSFCLPEDGKPLVYVAAGTGITPFRSFIQYLLHTEDVRDQTLFYSNRFIDQTFFFPELSSLAENNKIFFAPTMTRKQDSWDGRVGRIDTDFIREYIKDSRSWFYLCGSTPFVVAMKELLISMGVAEETIKTEKFGKIES